MSDFDPKDVVSVVTPAKTSRDFDPADIHTEVTPTQLAKAPITKGDSELAGLQQGGTLFTAPYIQGGIEAGLDKTQQLLNKFGLMDKSPTQVDADLTASGVKGDTGPQSTLDLYRQARDQSRAGFDAAQAANPASFGLGTVAGGLVTGSAIPGAIMAPLGGAAPGASVAARLGRAALNAAPTAAIASAGLSHADALQDPGQLAKDTAEGTGLGMGLGTGLEAGQMAIGGLANKITPATTKTAISRGLEGIDTTGPEFNQATHEANNANVNELADPIIAKQQAQMQAHADSTAALDSQIGDIQNDLKQANELNVAKQKATNAEDIKQINNDTVDTAKQVQAKILKVRQDLGKQYDSMDKAIEATNVAPDNRSVLENFNAAIDPNFSGLQPNQVNSIKKSLTPVAGQSDMQSFRNLKGLLNKYMQNPNPVVSKAARSAYLDLNTNLSSDLYQAGHEELANQLAATNKRWGAVAELQDGSDGISGHVDGIFASPTAGVVASPKTLSTVESFQGNSPTQIAKSQGFTGTLNAADPEGAPQTLQQIQDLANRANQAKNFTPEAGPTTNPELERLQNLLAQAKGNPPTQVPGLDQFPTNDPTALKNDLTKLLPGINENAGKDVSQNKLEQMLDYYRQNKGADYVDKDLTPRLQRTAEDVALRNSKAGFDAIPTDQASLIKRMIGGTNDVANSAARTVKKVSDAATAPVQDVARGIFNPKATSGLLQNGVGSLASSTPEELESLSTNFEASGTPEGKQYASVLRQTQGKSSVSKNAIMFGLMQQPSFRELFHKVVGGSISEDDNGQPGK